MLIEVLLWFFFKCQKSMGCKYSLRIMKLFFTKLKNMMVISRNPSAKSSSGQVKSFSTIFVLHSINGQYVKQGKLGAAALGNHTTKEVRALLTGHLFEITGLTLEFLWIILLIFSFLQYKLLLYLSQQKQVTAAKIHMGFVFTVSEHTQNWIHLWQTDNVMHQSNIMLCRLVFHRVGKVNKLTKCRSTFGLFVGVKMHQHWAKS